MFRSFCVGALAGFFFGSSKKGRDVRQGIDGFLTELTSTDAMKMLDEKKDEFTGIASDTFEKISTSFENKFKNFDGKDGDASNKSDKKEAMQSDKKDVEKKSERDLKDDSNDEAKMASKKESKNDAKEASEKENFEPGSDIVDVKPIVLDTKPLDVDKAQELADKLGAKPSAPEDENIAAFHAEDELKSA